MQLIKERSIFALSEQRCPRTRFPFPGANNIIYGMLVNGDKSKATHLIVPGPTCQGLRVLCQLKLKSGQFKLQQGYSSPAVLLPLALDTPHVPVLYISCSGHHVNLLSRPNEPKDQGKDIRHAGWRARIGYITPAPAEADVCDFYQIVPPGVSLVITALSVQELDARSLESALNQSLAGAIRDLAGEEVDFIVAGGQPMLLLKGHGSEQMLSRMAAEITSIPFTHNLTSAIKALRHLGIRRVALAAPYSVRDSEGNDVTYARWNDYLAQAGFEMVGFSSSGQLTNREIGLPDYAPYQVARGCRRSLFAS